MSMKTLFSGIPGVPSFTTQQDDFVANVASKIGNVSISRSPSVVTRVYLPPFDQWEQRTGNSFGFRAALVTTVNKSIRPLLRRDVAQVRNLLARHVHLFHKGRWEEQGTIGPLSDSRRRNGARRVGTEIKQTGWWTLGMSFSPDGNVHYFIRPGVEDLTRKDFVATHTPYSYHAERFDTFFYDVLNMDDGKSWSTEWIVDDPGLYLEGR